MKYLEQLVTGFTSTNIVDATPVWDSITAYTAGNFVIYGTYTYKCVSTNTNKSPATNTGVYWVKWAVSNQYAMLDKSSATKSYLNSGNITVEFLQGNISTVIAGNFEASYMQIDVLDGAGISIWSNTSPVNGSATGISVSNYYSYVFNDYTGVYDQYVMFNIPIKGTKIRCTFIKEATATRTACGYLYGGVPTDMGCTLYGVKFGYHSFAVRKTDDFGSITITKRAIQELIDFETIIPSETLGVIRRNIKSVYDSIVVFILDEKEISPYSNLLTLGIIESVNVILSNSTTSRLTWSIVEGI